MSYEGIMRIYIDEAGNFVSQVSGQSLYSLVLALLVSSSIEAGLFAEFSSLLSGWPNSGTEIKGSKLDETQVAQLIDLVSRHDVFADFFAVDMATHGETVVSDFKERQAAGITANLTPEHHPPIVAQLEGLAAAIRRMPNQLFVHALLMIELVLKIIEDSTLYYVQRVPAELGSIAWTIDRKDRTITEMENTWSTLVQQDPAPLYPVRCDPSERHQDQHRDRGREVDRRQRECGPGQRGDDPALGELLHPRAGL